MERSRAAAEIGVQIPGSGNLIGSPGSCPPWGRFHPSELAPPAATCRSLHGRRVRRIQGARGGPPALPSPSRSRSSLAWAPGMGSRGFKSPSIRGALRCGRAALGPADKSPFPWPEGSPLFASRPWAVAKPSG